MADFDDENEYDKNDDSVSSNEIVVYIKNLSGEIAEFNVKLDDKISVIIEKYKSINNYKSGTQVLLYHKGKTMKPEQTFRSIEITNESTFNAVVRLSGGVI